MHLYQELQLVDDEFFRCCTSEILKTCMNLYMHFHLKFPPDTHTL